MNKDLNTRSQHIFKYIVDAYVETGMPIGSKTLSTYTDIGLSSASIRNIMADLERMELLYAPHVSSGRMPTQKGLRFYIDGLMELGGLSSEERQAIDTTCQAQGHSPQSLMDQTSQLLSGLSNCAGLVMAPKTNNPVKQIQFIRLQPRRILVVLVTQEDMVENRILDTDHDIPQSILDQAGNYLNNRLDGKTLDQARHTILQEIHERRSELDAIAASLVEQGLALPRRGEDNYLIIRGQSKLLEDVRAMEELEKAKELLALLEEKETTMGLLGDLDKAQGVQIYIGTENDVFSHSGWSVVLSPYKLEDKVVGAIGVIGPMRINYGRIIPIVDYTAKVMQKILAKDVGETY